MRMASRDEWFELAHKVWKKGEAILGGARLPLTECGASDSKVVAMTLLARTLGNANAAILLVKHGSTVEARTLVRCCYENLFWIAALAKQGRDFIVQVGLDDKTNRIKRGKALLDWSAGEEREEDFEKELADFIVNLENSTEKPSTISLYNAAGAGGIGGAYIFYRELSTDAAHPSATSLSRHVVENTEGIFTLYANPVVDSRENEDTLELLCSALIGCCVAAEEILNQHDLGEPLVRLAEVFRVCSDSNKVARDREPIL
jgi:hypothetical protein